MMLLAKPTIIIIIIIIMIIVIIIINCSLFNADNSSKGIMVNTAGNSKIVPDKMIPFCVVTKRKHIVY